jgi:hypothetical protein
VVPIVLSAAEGKSILSSRPAGEKIENQNLSLRIIKIAGPGWLSEGQEISNGNSGVLYSTK